MLVAACVEGYARWSVYPVWVDSSNGFTWLVRAGRGGRCAGRIFGDSCRLTKWQE